MNWIPGRVIAAAIVMAGSFAACGGDADEPWRGLEAPPMPVFPVVLPTDVARIERVCIETVADGVRVDDLVMGFERTLELLGVSAVDSGCDASLVVAAIGSRLSADYINLGRCWTGSQWSTETSLVVAGVVQGTWTDSDKREPLVRISDRGCTDEDAPVQVSRSPVEEPITAMFGPIGGFVHQFLRGQDMEFAETVVVTDEVVLLLSALVANESIMGLRNVDVLTRHLHEAGRTRELEALAPLIPHLIALHGCPETCKADPAFWPSRAVQRTLETISGRQFTSQADWWAWWVAAP